MWPALVQLMVRGLAAVVAHALAAERVAMVAQRAQAAVAAAVAEAAAAARPER